MHLWCSGKSIAMMCFALPVLLAVPAETLSIRLHHETHDRAESLNFLHIAKTAGTSLILDLAPHLAVHTQGWNKEGCIPENTKLQSLMTFARNPAAHVYSQWLHCRDNKDNFFNPQNLPGSFHEWLEHWVSVGDGARETHDPNESFNCYHPMNLQSRVLSCTKSKWQKYSLPGLDNYILSDLDGFLKEDLDLALQHLKEMYTVGVTDFYQESLCVLHVREKNKYPPYCDCEHEEWKNFPTSHINHGGAPHKSYTVEVNADDMELIHQLTEHDSQIYAFALKRLREDISEIEWNWGKRMWCHGEISSAFWKAIPASTNVTLFDWD